MHEANTLLPREKVFASTCISKLELNAQANSRNAWAEVLSQHIERGRADVVVPYQSCIGIEQVEYIQDSANTDSLRFELLGHAEIGVPEIRIAKVVNRRRHEN